VRPLATLSVLLLSSCLVSTLPVSRPIDRRLVLGEPGEPQVILEADWRIDGERYCVSRAPVDLITEAGTIRFHEADLCATQHPPALEGDARVPLPAIGVLAGLVAGETPRGRLSLARGRELGALALGQERLPAEPSHFYLAVDYASSPVVALASASLSMAAASPRLIIDPTGPVLYFAGDLAGILPSPIAGAAFGLSPAGALPYTTAQPLYDGTASEVRRLSGHLLVQGTFALGDLPVTITGRVVVDLDGDDDGVSVLGGDAHDVALAGDANLRVAVAVGSFRVDMPLAQASFLRAAEGTLFFAGAAPATLFAGTSFASFEPRADLAVRGVFRSPTDFALLVRGDGRLLGLPFHEAQVELGSATVKLRGRLEVAPVGEIEVAGGVTADGSWALAGRAADLRYAGLPITDVQVAITPRGPSVSGTTTFLGRPFRLSGGIGPGGALALTGTLAISTTSRIQLGLDARGARAWFEGRVCASGVCLDVPATELDAQGNLCQSFPVIGRRCVKVI